MGEYSPLARKAIHKSMSERELDEKEIHALRNSFDRIISLQSQQETTQTNQTPDEFASHIISESLRIFREEYGQRMLTLALPDTFIEETHTALTRAFARWTEEEEYYSDTQYEDEQNNSNTPYSIHNDGGIITIIECPEGTPVRMTGSMDINPQNPLESIHVPF